MAKPAVSAASFLKNLRTVDSEPIAPAKAEPEPEPVASLNAAPALEPIREKPVAKKENPKGRAGLKHIGGYLDRETVELIAILRARLNLDNSELIKKAIEELYGRENAARKFGDR